MQWILLIGLLVVAGGCSYLQPIAGRIADGVDRYCAEPFNSRQLIRATVDELTAHQVRVHCVGDPDFPAE